MDYMRYQNRLLLLLLLTFRLLHILTISKETILAMVTSHHVDHHTVVHIVVQRDERGGPAGNRGGAGGGTRRGHRRGQETEGGRADDPTDSIHWAQAWVREHLERQNAS